MYYEYRIKLFKYIKNILQNHFGNNFQLQHFCFNHYTIIVKDILPDMSKSVLVYQD